MLRLTPVNRKAFPGGWGYIGMSSVKDTQGSGDKEQGLGKSHHELLDTNAIESVVEG